MEIKLELDEAKILSKAMQGLSKSEIEHWAIDHAIHIAKSRLSEIIEERVNRLVNSTNMQESIDKGITQAMKDDISKYMTPDNLRKKFKKADWDRLFEETVSPVLTNFIEYALSDWLAINITVGTGKQKKELSVAGTDSYTFRKKS
jgi:hypothetical protein